MSDSKQRDLIITAYVNEFQSYPEKAQQLISFIKTSSDLSNINLKFSEARYIINTSRRKFTKNGLKLTKYKISPKKGKRKKTKYKISPKKKDKEQHSLDYTIGDHILLTQDREGIIRYIGNVSSAKEMMYGIELLNGAIGKHDGTYHDKRYFKAPKQRGIFVKKMRIRRKIRRKERRSSNQLNRDAAIKQLKDRKKGTSLKVKTKSPKTPTETGAEKRWIPPYTIYKSSPTSPFRSERSYIHRPHSPMCPDKDSIDASSMSIMYTKASMNLHRHILQKVNQVKIRNDIRNKALHAFSAHSKLHSPMVPIHIQAMSPIITSEAVTTIEMRKMMKNKRKHPKKTSLIKINHKRPTVAVAVAVTVDEEKPTQIMINDEEKHSQNREELNIETVLTPITFSPRDARFSDLVSPVMSNVPPLTQVTINYIEMEQKLNHLCDILIEKEDCIQDGYALYDECDITDRDLNEELFAWVDLLCTHSKLFATTARVKNVERNNSFFATKDSDDNVYTCSSYSDDDDDDDDDDNASTPTEKEKAKQVLRKKNARMMRNNREYFDENAVYYYTVFERLLFELDFFYLYFIYDIGFDNSNAFNEQHPCQLFLLSGNMSQILKKCAPLLYRDIDIFRRCILDPFHLKIRYKCLNNDSEWNRISLIKYGEEDGIRNDYSFVARIQYEQMFDASLPHTGRHVEDELVVSEEEMVNDLAYELIAYHKGKRKAIAIYKSVIPSVFSINYEMKLTNLKRTILCPSLILNNKCHIECEKWNQDGDYYGFVRINILNNFVINKESIISAKECGYYNKCGLGVGSFKNDIRNKTKYYSGGSYGTAAVSPHELCPTGSVYGEDCLQANYLYYGSPCADDNERGGGIIDIVCGATLINHGNICCDGANGMQFGGSAGGSIKIVALNLINYGSITANGGKGAQYQRKGSKRKQIGTDGGDGRIFIICNTFVNKGHISPAPTIINIEMKQIDQYKLSHIKSLNEETAF